MIIAAMNSRVVVYTGGLVAFAALWFAGTWQAVQVLRRERRILATPLAVLTVEYRDDEVAFARVADARRTSRRTLGGIIVTALLCAFVLLLLLLVVLSAARVV